ncbi:hypothetical protein [Neokomagataea thailandica]|uniref:hypothetical protein n=1 Tax=Neokomagataea TaxID=1223423 RepID=UPI0012EDA984|nr:MULTISPECIES: hypothetical protein [Neokomagataea]
MSDLHSLLSSAREGGQPELAPKPRFYGLWVILVIDVILVSAALLIHFLWPVSH